FGKNQYKTLPLHSRPAFPKLKMQFGPKGIQRAILICFPIIVLPFYGCSPKFSNIALPFNNLKEFPYQGTDVLEDKWWTAFNDKQLNMLIDSALRSNLNL